MESELIIVSEYCNRTNISLDFILLLEDEGLIETCVIDDRKYLTTSQLLQIEKYTRWHYDLSINIEGIDVIQNLLDKMDKMQEEMNRLKNLLQIKMDDNQYWDV